MAQALGLSVALSIVLSFLSLVFFVSAVAIWTTLTVFTVGFALRTRKASRFQWGLTLAILLATPYVWAKHPSGFVTASHLAALGAGVLLVCGVVLSFRLAHKLRTHFLTNAGAFVILALPCGVAYARAAKEPPNAQRLWSTVLERGTWQAMNTGSDFAATRQVAFAGDRVLAIFDAGFPQYEGKQPMSKYRLVSLDAKTGEIKNLREFGGPWGAMPYVFPTDDGHIILEQGSLRSLNPDLSNAGPKFDPDHGRVIYVSPDDSTMAWETDPGTVLLDSHSLIPSGKRFAESVPSSVSATAVLTGNISWSRDYPNDRTFVGLRDETWLPPAISWGLWVPSSVFEQRNSDAARLRKDQNHGRSGNHSQRSHYKRPRKICRRLPEWKTPCTGVLRRKRRSFFAALRVLHDLRHRDAAAGRDGSDLRYARASVLVSVLP